MNRRDAMGALGAWALIPGDASALAAQAARAERPFRVGLVIRLPEDRLKLLADSLATLGWAAGKDYVLVHTDIPYGPRIDDAAKLIVAERPDVILVVGSAYAVAVRRLTTTTPIVMTTSGYPVAAGLAESLARPGLNVTGNTSYAGTGVWGKMFQLLAEVKPGLRRVGLLWDYVPPAFLKEEVDFGLVELREDARALGLTLHFADIHRPEDAVPAFRDLQARQAEALLITSGPNVFAERARLTELAVAHRLPTISDIRWAPQLPHGPLMSYGAVNADLWRQAAWFVDRILRGAKAGELPIQQPSRFELVINGRVARELSLAIPQKLLLRADEVID